LVIEQRIPGVTRLGPAIEWQIVGVYRKVRNAGPRGADFPEMDVPFWQSPWPSAAIAIRTAGDPNTIQKSVAAVVQSVDPDLPLADGKTMDQMVEESLAGDLSSEFGIGNAECGTNVECGIGNACLDSARHGAEPVEARK
jgi:putative ABC transport system permease protein